MSAVNHSFTMEARGLTKKYGDFVAVNDVSLSVKPGEIVGFLGPNGAGKTTTMRMLIGLLRPNAGQVSICGYNLEDDPINAKARIGWVPAEPNLYAKLTALEYLRFMARLYHVPSEKSEPLIHQMLEDFELAEVSGTRLEGFSHGMQQKTAIIGALLHDPQILCLDEPTVGLDPRSSRLLKDILRRVRENGRSVMFSTHILEVAENLVDRVIIIDRGRIVAEGTLEALRQQSGDDGSLEDVFLKLTEKAEDAPESTPAPSAPAPRKRRWG